MRDDTKRLQPFDSDLTRTHSSYTAYRDGRLVLLLVDERPAPPLAQFVHGQLRALLLDPGFPCVGAKAAVNQGNYRFGMYGPMASPEATVGLCYDLSTFVDEQLKMGSDFTTYIASFSGLTPKDEQDFEHLVWRQLQGLHDIDSHYHAWDPTVSCDPEDARFSFSFARRAFFIVGLHPGSSRWSRRFAWPTLVFNAHYQFDRLRASGQFERFQDIIRAKDQKLQGAINPNLANFGQSSEARQYAGRPVEPEWKCPLHVHQKEERT